MNECYIIYGGAGFVGQHMANSLLQDGWGGHIFLCDIKKPEDHPSFSYLAKWIEAGQISFVKQDVREQLDASLFSGYAVRAIYNFAAIHREPGHERTEYFETNILGAENVCALAEKVGCNELIFTSSISPYGPSESEIYESSLTSPETAYGSSKLAAEYIHRLWQQKSSGRKLLILRPGVIFGPGEGGNVTRLVRMINKFGFFFRVGAGDVRKAGIYIKELCLATTWIRQNKLGADVLVVNMTFDPGPTLQEYVVAVSNVASIRPRMIKIPHFLLMGAAYSVSKLLNGSRLAKQLDPVRVRKITRSNNVRAGKLKEFGYSYAFDLRAAFTDWRNDFPRDWLR